MNRRVHRENQGESLNIFQAFTDLMSNAFMIISFFLLISLIQTIMLKQKLESAAPIIIDEKSGKFKFQSGSAEIPDQLKTHINQKIISDIKKVTKQGNIEFIQIIGHTDGQANKSFSNLDASLTSAASSKQPIISLQAGSNADLGLMRAVAVVQLLRKTKGLESVKFRAYSAAQLYLPDGKIATSNETADDSRRRIEIRFIPKGVNNKN